MMTVYICMYCMYVCSMYECTVCIWLGDWNDGTLIADQETVSSSCILIHGEGRE